jgi:hypothetical protein
MTELARIKDAEGIAALGIWESLLLALTDFKIISEQDARDVLTNVATHTSKLLALRKRLRSIRGWSRFYDASSLV